MRPHVLELTLITKFEWADVHPADRGRIEWAIQRACYPANHTKHSVSLFVVTRETPQELLDRIGPRMETVTAVQDFRCIATGTLPAAAKNGGDDPIIGRLAEAWHEAERIGKRSKAEDLRQVRPGDVLAKHGIDVERTTAIKMAFRGPWQSKPTTDADDPKS